MSAPTREPPARTGPRPPIQISGAAEAPRSYILELDAAPEAILSAVATAAEQWGARWQPDSAAGGELDLPALAGIRQGVHRGRLWAAPRPGGGRIELAVTAVAWRVNRPAAAILAIGAAGALAATMWPFHPVLLRLAPLGVALAIATWLLVASRLRTAGPEDFLEQVARLAADATEGSPER